MKPYNSTVLNKFDGIILHLITFVAVLLLFDDFDLPFIITVAFVLVILPLLIFIFITLFLQRDSLKKISTYFTSKRESPSSDDANNNIEVPMKKFHIIVDDSARKKLLYVTCK